MAVEENVELMELVAPVQLAPSGDDVIMTLQNMKISPGETSGGRARVVPDGDSTRSLKVRKIFTAIGADVQEPWQLPPEGNTDTLQLSHCTLTAKDLPLVFGGDLTNSLKSVTDAIASGKQAAVALDVFFTSGLDAAAEKLDACRVGSGPALSMESYLKSGRSAKKSHSVSYAEINTDYFSTAAPVSAAHLDAAKRIQSFAEIEGTFTGEQAQTEAGRCFNCGICNACGNCRIFCPEVAVTLTETLRQVNLDYCKGCGICVTECPRNAMALEEEI
jgi:Pyruvate/2-oxoacid:ferredoxin oxidoreductase delta subunit